MRRKPDAKDAVRLAAVDALREIVEILSRQRVHPQLRIDRAERLARSTLTRYRIYRRRAARRRYGARGVDHGQARRAEWIVAALASRKRIDIDDLARRLRVDVRTAYRDIAYLRMRGAPVRYDRARRTYYLPPLI